MSVRGSVRCRWECCCLRRYHDDKRSRVVNQVLARQCFPARAWATRACPRNQPFVRMAIPDDRQFDVTTSDLCRAGDRVGMEWKKDMPPGCPRRADRRRKWFLSRPDVCTGRTCRPPGREVLPVISPEQREMAEGGPKIGHVGLNRKYFRNTTSPVVGLEVPRRIPRAPGGRGCSGTDVG